jgi:hypothetical protein
MFATLFRSPKFGPSSPARLSPKRPPTRLSPRLESLEDRSMMSATGMPSDPLPVQLDEPTMVCVDEGTPNMAWHNPVNGLDVTDSTFEGPGDGVVSPGDALAIINFINANGPGPVADCVPDEHPSLDTVNSAGEPFGDGHVAPGDALAVINFINRYGNGLAGPSGTREVTGESPVSLPLDSVDDTVSLSAITPSISDQPADTAATQHAAAVDALMASFMDEGAAAARRRGLVA